MLRLNNYLLRNFPNPPQTADYSFRAMGSLSDVYGNDVAGCCTISASFHLAAVMLANGGRPVPFQSSDVLALYRQLSGWNGVEDDPSDQGLVETQALNYWAEKGLNPGAHTINGYVQVSANDMGEIMAALWLFENVYFAASLPDAWIDPMPGASGFVWDVAGAPDQANGHAWCGVGYDAIGVKIDTWGMLGKLTWAAIAQYCTVYTVLSTDIIDRVTRLAPSGVNWTQLVSDIESLGPVQT